MISAEAPILFAKACEMFIVEMTHKAYYYAKKNNRKTLQRNDIAAAITDTEIYDFLLDIMPRDEMMLNAKDKQLVRARSIDDFQLEFLPDAASRRRGPYAAASNLATAGSVPQGKPSWGYGTPSIARATTSSRTEVRRGCRRRKIEGT